MTYYRLPYITHSLFIPDEKKVSGTFSVAILAVVSLLGGNDDLCPHEKILRDDFSLNLRLLALLFKEAVGH